MLAFNWVMQIVATIFIAVHDYSWLITDPIAHYALVQADCMFPTPSCLYKAKIVHRQAIQEHLNYYWCTIGEETTKLEHEKQTKDDHDRYIAEQLAKGDKWDRWEVSPPTINFYNHNHNHNSFINPTFISLTFVSTCTAPPEIPELDVELLAASELISTERHFSLKLVLCVTISLGFMSWMLFRIIRSFASSSSILPDPRLLFLPAPILLRRRPKRSLLNTMSHQRRPPGRHEPANSPLPASKLADAISAAPAEDPTPLPPAAQVDEALR
ncbi:hypothetical protein N0V95_009482 [Ascochyta clinopodiicola]|nr:hypothetical protein N0V95_009482 [Ascochyta clinopodiicola]